MTPELTEFVSRYLRSFAVWDLLEVFDAGAITRGTAASIARMTGRPEAEIARELHFLAFEGFLAVCDDTPEKEYLYEPSPSLARLVGEFVSAMNERKSRLQVLSMLLRHHAAS